MPNPLRVSLENIIPLTEARDHFSQIVNEVQRDKLYVLTKGGKPAVAIVDVKYLEAITGGNVNQNYVKEEIKKAPEKVGLAPMIEHKTPPITPLAPKPFAPPVKPFTPPASLPGGPSPMTTPTPSAPMSTPAPPPTNKPPTPSAPMSTPAPPSTPPATPAKWPSSPAPTTTAPVPPPPTNNPSAPTPPTPTPTPTPPGNTKAVIETNINPFDTKPQTVQTPQPAQPAQTTPISINFSPDYNEKEMKNQNGQAAPEDKPGPAQYAGSSTAAGADAHSEPDDMAID